MNQQHPHGDKQKQIHQKQDLLVKEQRQILEQQFQMFEHKQQMIQFEQQRVNQVRKQSKNRNTEQHQANVEGGDDDDDDEQIQSWEKQYSLLWTYDELILRLKDPETVAEFDFIAENLCTMTAYIRRLETEALPARTAIESLRKVEETLKSVENMPQNIIDKFDSVFFSKNEGFLALKTYFESDGEIKLSPLDKWTEDQLDLLEYFPVVTSPVERSFSIYKIMFRSNRRQLKFSNFRKYVIAMSILQQVMFYLLLKYSENWFFEQFFTRFYSIYVLKIVDLIYSRIFIEWQPEKKHLFSRNFK